jgi:hypothetical protein
MVGSVTDGGLPDGVLGRGGAPGGYGVRTARRAGLRRARCVDVQRLVTLWVKSWLRVSVPKSEAIRWASGL